MRLPVLFLLLLPFFFSCKSGRGLFGSKRLHEQYAQKLKDAGLDQTALGRQWLSAAETALATPQSITLPYKEQGYFAAERPGAAGLRFSAKTGQKVLLRIDRNPANGFLFFVELWRVAPNTSPTFVKATDSTQNILEQEIEGNETYILRLQPELLKSGDYTLTISLGPTLDFPVPGGSVGSIWGDARDAGARKHEGIDIFAPRRTPTIAAADGLITSVRNGGIGGKTIFMRPEGKPFTLYYAHLEEQLVSSGQRVELGDTIGLVGNTGNAATTPPHLHFGIYQSGGAVNPLPFVNPKVQRPSDVNIDLNRLKIPLRVASPVETEKRSYPLNTIVYPMAATDETFRVALPDGTFTSILRTNIRSTKDALRPTKTKRATPLLDSPVLGAPKKQEIQAASTINILGYFGEYTFVESKSVQGWIHSAAL